LAHVVFCKLLIDAAEEGSAVKSYEEVRLTGDN
jgi:hypothetical protein